MNRITKVELSGFKGQNRTVELGARTVLSGPNGLGKSAILEAVRYALSGEVPSGRTNDEVAKHFPDRGGTVTVTDAAGNFLRRGIERDHEKHEVSTVLEAEGDAEWIANEALLDMRGFLGLSPNKRREFVLKLVGAGETPTDLEIHQALARDYARQIGGPGANASILSDRLDDLPEEIRPVAGRWLAIWGVFTSYLRTGENTASAIFQRLVDAAKDRKNSSRRAATEAKAAIRELEAAAKGARAAAAELEKRRYEAEEAADAFGAAREEAARREQAQKAVVAEDMDRAALASRLELCETAVVEDPGERPALETAQSEEAKGLRQQADAVQEAANEIIEERRTLETARGDMNAASNFVRQAEYRAGQLAAEPIGRAVAAAERVRQLDWEHWNSGCRQAMAGLLELVDELAASWKTRRDENATQLAEASHGARLAEWKHKEIKKATRSEAHLAILRGKQDELEKKASALDAANLDRIKAEEKALEEWEGKTRRAAAVLAGVKALRERYEATRQRHHELAEKLAEMPYRPVQALQEDVQVAKAALEEAEEAAGEVKAYEEAVERAESEKVAEKAWGAAESACKHARESYVADVVKPLVDDVAALLAAAGRQEQVYLALENERGKAIFDLGWTLGESRRSLSALSGGEAVLFTVALALTIAQRSAGRRVLLIEADPLDETNLGQLLGALAAINHDLDACLVATSTFMLPADGWKCIQFLDDGLLRIRSAEREVA